MSIGTSTTIALGLVAAGQGAAAIGAAKKASAAKHAAAQQVAAADKAQGYNEGVYRDQRALMAPYIQSGGAAYQKLLGEWQARQPGGAPQMPQGPPQGPQGMPWMPGSRPQGGAPTMGQAVPRTPMAGPQGMPGQPQGGQQMVTMTSPDGSETQSVPQQHVPQYLARGAKVVA